MVMAYASAGRAGSQSGGVKGQARQAAGGKQLVCQLCTARQQVCNAVATHAGGTTDQSAPCLFPPASNLMLPTSPSTHRS